MTRKAILAGAVLAVLVLGLTPQALAKDAVKASVTPQGSPVPIMKENGTPYSSGTYAIGTIQLFYTVSAFQFPSGNFASFQLDMMDMAYTANPATSYPVTLNLVQTGSSNLVLSPLLSSFIVSGTGWSGSSIVTISIPASVASDPSLNLDGTDLIGNLQMVTSPQGAHLDTVTTVQVHIKLVHPTACLRVYNFFTDQAFTTIVTSTDVNVNNKGKVTATNPFGQLSDNILVVNTCSTPISFDLQIELDSSFQTNPNGNPGNAVFVYLTSGYMDPSTFNMAAFGSGTPQGQHLCLCNLTVPAGDTMLITVHMGIIRNMLASALPADGTFDFGAEVYAAGSTLNCTTSGSPHPLADPSYAYTPLPFTIR